MSSHETLPGTDIYGPGTFVDKEFTPSPQDAGRIFEYIAKGTPGFTQDQELMEHTAALHAMCPEVAHEIVEDHDGTPAKSQNVTVNTDHAAIWLETIFTASI
ncbi:hypothetical protein PENANT_c022G10790 [Penicillium antarcticum]|uniref:Uncharacterized protein n=1 Tax=Penicillium antarcticum TaxID=416450 RepID=A0A1V6Q0N3_9EURO|nr:hypothetical protein PENANT_c022G10790 [Penicillium antarcticum]